MTEQPDRTLSKQEEIEATVLKFVAFLIDETPPKECRVTCIASATQRLLSYLHDNGVVIKVAREWPRVPTDASHNVALAYKQTVQFAGYVAVEPLIGDKDG